MEKFKWPMGPIGVRMTSDLLFKHLMQMSESVLAEDHHLYTDKFRIGVVDLTRTDLATEEDRKHNVDKWAAFFNAEKWEDLEMLAQTYPIIEEAATHLRKLTEDEKFRQQQEAWEDRQRRVNGLKQLADEANARADASDARAEKAEAETKAAKDQSAADKARAEAADARAEKAEAETKAAKAEAKSAKAEAKSAIDQSAMDKARADKYLRMLIDNGINPDN